MINITIVKFAQIPDIRHVTLKMRQTRPHGRMKILSFIEDPEIIKKILKHLDLWDLESKPLPRANAPPNKIEPHLNYSHRLPAHRAYASERG
jgi:hypothetical protein